MKTEELVLKQLTLALVHSIISATTAVLTSVSAVYEVVKLPDSCIGELLLVIFDVMNDYPSSPNGV